MPPLYRAPLPQPDFLHPTRRAGWLPWAWCATGLLVLAAAGLEAADAWRQRQDAQGRLARALQPAPRPSAPLPDAVEARGDAAAARWLQRLAQPWPLVFGAAEVAAVDGVAFTGLSFDAQGALRLEGQADDAGSALAAAQALRSHDDEGRAAWQGVMLSRLDSLPGPGGQRFEIVARLAPAAGR